ncbi:MAG: hypothetical protein VB859_05660 [Planctomycetaceae bacterium]
MTNLTADRPGNRGNTCRHQAYKTGGQFYQFAAAINNPLFDFR